MNAYRPAKKHHWQDIVVEFADCLIGAHHRRQGCQAPVTFNAKAARLPGFAPV